MTESIQLLTLRKVKKVEVKEGKKKVGDVPATQTQTVKEIQAKYGLITPPEAQVTAPKVRRARRGHPRNW